MSNVHIHLHVSDIDASRSFYERFLGAEPVKIRPGYVKFLPELAPINLALSAGEAGAGKTVDHLGFQVETRDAVQALLQRVKATGIAVREEMGSDCCYANQDKFWVRDPDGIEWEIYHLNYDLEDQAIPAAPSNNDATCCTPLARLSKRPSAG
jgi:catechol 2,3-dioxygenase-like lactoylglutathione lyase family enzyme